jgi:hypothetical protein
MVVNLNNMDLVNSRAKARHCFVLFIPTLKHWVSGLILLKSILIENNKFTLPFRVGIIQNCKWGFSPTLTQWNKKRISSVKKHWVSKLILLKSILIENNKFTLLFKVGAE